ARRAFVAGLPPCLRRVKHLRYDSPQIRTRFSRGYDGRRREISAPELCRRGLARGKAVVASFTRCLCIFFAKVSKQSHAPAFTRLGVMNHLLKLCPRDSRFAFALFVDEMELFRHIARAEEQHAFARQSVPACA